MSWKTKIILLSVMLFGLALGGAKWHGGGSKPAADFSELLAAAKQTRLDLRNFYPGAWDELAIWLPYGDICAYGIKGYERGSLHCRSSTDDGDCQLLFLRRNELAFAIPINRRQIDLTTLKVSGRIARRQAVFQFDSQGDWPKMSLAK